MVVGADRRDAPFLTHFYQNRVPKKFYQNSHSRSFEGPENDFETQTSLLRDAKHTCLRCERYLFRVRKILVSGRENAPLGMKATCFLRINAVFAFKVPLFRNPNIAQLHPQHTKLIATQSLSRCTLYERKNPFNAVLGRKNREIAR